MQTTYSVACTAALLAVVVTYSNHFRSDFHFDDAHTIQNNLFIRDVRSIPRFFTTPATFSSLPANHSYRPLVTTTLAVDYRLAGGLKPMVFHITSFTLFRQTLQSYELSVHWDGTRDNNTSAPSMTADGSGIAFAADPPMLIDNWCLIHRNVGRCLG